MSIVLRVWKVLKVLNESKESIKKNWTIWDRGDEMWELKGDVLRHFEVLDRCYSTDSTHGNNVITERLRLLPESAIPLEAIRHSIQGWEIEDSIEAVSVAKSSPQAKPVLPLTSSQPSTPIPSLRINAHLLGGVQLGGLPKKASLPCKNLLHAGTKMAGSTVVSSTTVALANEQGTQKCVIEQEKELPSEEKSHPVTPLQATQEMLEEYSSQHFYNHPTELWSSLSQWIPQHALFQPSLHHQATLELSDTPAQTYPYQIDSSKNSRPAQGQHQHVRHGQHSRPYRPKPSSHEIEIPKRPLFV